MLSKRYARVEPERCVACGTCINVCPKAAVELFHGCFAQVDAARCVGCGLCARACPADCIALREREVTA